MSHSLLHTLESHPFVSDFSPQDRARLAAPAKEVRLPAGTKVTVKLLEPLTVRVKS